MTKQKSSPQNIASNRKAHHDYHLEDFYEAGICLEGWEVKSIRDARVQLKDSHVIIRKGEAFLLNTHITPLPTASTHVIPDPTRTRKLLLHRRQLNTLIGKVEQKGYTIVPIDMHWHQNRVKVEIALARGKKLFDKRAAEKEKDWEREKARHLKKLN
ncbi:MAG: SsrA-binding protein SmpB [Gammaproteobacteria bacterium]|nr:SsrA-binding protein SmpB [Gammaproteobacteria bacterium]